MGPALRIIPVILATLTLAAVGQESRTTLTAAEREALSWIASLFPFDPTGKPYVEVVARNDAPRPGWSWKQITSCRGFLLDEREDSFRVWCLDLLPRRIERGVRSFGDFRSHEEIVRLDLDAGARSLIEAIERNARKRKTREASGPVSTYFFADDEVSSDSDGALDHGYQALVLASLSARLGREDLAVALCEASCACPKESHQPSLLLVARFEPLLRGHCVRVLGQPDFSRKDVLAYHRRYLELFPRGENDVVVERVRILEEMVRDDGERSRRTSAGSRPSDQEVADLIHDLRDASEPLPLGTLESKWPATPHPWKRDGVPARLVALGHRAVPQLIDALGDERPTRCVEPDYGSFSRPEGHVNRVGTYAWAILSEIAHVCFHGSEARGFGVSSQQAAAREWFDRLQKDGEAAALEARLAADSAEGPYSGIEPARRLAQIAPERAIVAIGHAIDQAQKILLRGDLVITLGAIPGDGPVPKLLHVVEHAPDLRSRLEAAEALHRRGRPEGLAAMIREWNRDTLPRVTGPFYDMESKTWEPMHPFLDSGWGTWAGGVAAELARFLASTNDPAAVAALIEKLAHGSGMHRRAAMCAARQTSGESPAAPALHALRVATERLLVGELSNTGPSGTVLMSAAGQIEERWCDHAARWLASLHPGWPFDWTTSTGERDRQIAVILEAWDAERRQAPPELEESQPESQPETRLVK